MPRRCIVCRGTIEQSRSFPSKKYPEHREEWLSRLNLSLDENADLRAKHERDDGLLWCQRHFLPDEELPMDVGNLFETNVYLPDQMRTIDAPFTPSKKPVPSRYNVNDPLIKPMVTPLRN